MTETQGDTPIHDGGAWSPVPGRIVASWTPGAFAENVAVDAAGTVFVSVHGLSRIDRYDPGTDVLTTFTSLDAPPMGLAFDGDGFLWATAGAFPLGPGSVWRISPLGEAERWTDLPDAPFINGCAFHPDGRALLACDSLTGRILAIDAEGRDAWRPWLSDPLLGPGTAGGVGANGIKIRGSEAWVTVSSRRLVLRVPIGSDGGSTTPSIFARNLLGDDFAIASSGAIYVTTHPKNSVVRLDPSGRRSTIAGSEQGAEGATACAFGRASDDAAVLYVTTAGTRGASDGSAAGVPKLLRLEVGEAGG